MKKQPTLGRQSVNKTTPKKAEKAASNIDVTSLDELLGFHLRRAMASLISDYNRRVLHGKIRPGLATLMRLVADNPGASQISLARALGVDKATLVGLIDIAEENNWLLRERSEIDRRRHKISTTKEGEKVVDDLNARTIKMEEKYKARFNNNEYAKLIEYLQRIYCM